MFMPECPDNAERTASDSIGIVPSAFLPVTITAIVRQRVEGLLQVNYLRDGTHRDRGP